MEIGPRCYRSRQEEMVLWNVSICNSLSPRLLLLQIEMFEAVSLQAELGRLVAALEACCVESHHAKVCVALVSRIIQRGWMHMCRLSLH